MHDLCIWNQCIDIIVSNGLFTFCLIPDVLTIICVQGNINIQDGTDRHVT